MSALSFETALPHPLLQHVQRDAVHSGINPKPMTEPFRTAMWRIWQACLDHDAFDDLPNAHATEWPNRSICLLAGFLRLPNAMRCVQRVEEIRRHNNGSVHYLLAALGILPLDPAP